MATLLGSLLVSLGLDSGQFRFGLTDAEKQMKATQKNFERIGSNFTKVGAALTVGITAPFAALIAKSIPAARESAEAMGQVNAALASMGTASGRSAEQLQQSATALMHLSTFDDDEILRKVTANLLTFGTVAGEQFDRAQRAAVDLSTRMGGDLQASTILVGKALNDPIKGMGALRKVGIQLTEQQRDQVEAFVAAGNAAGAQRVILGELEHQFGGSAKAMRDATPGADLKNSWDDFQETVGGLALRVLPPLTSGLSRVIELFNTLAPTTQAIAVGAAAVAAVLGPVAIGLGGIISLSAPMLAAMTQVGAGLAGVSLAEGVAATTSYALGTAIGAALLPLLPFIAAFAGAAALVYAAFQHWDDIQPVLQSLWETIQDVFGPPLLEVFDAVKATMSDLWNGPFGELMREAFANLKLGFEVGKVALSAFGTAVTPIVEAVGRFGSVVAQVIGSAIIADLKALGTVVAAVFRVMGDVLNAVAALLQGRWSEAWTYAKRAAVDAVRGLVDGVKALLTGPLGAAMDWVRDKAKAVGDAFFQLYDRVVGHSYVPDMVDEIGAQMARLDANMVGVARSATSKAAQAFKDMQSAVSPILDRLFPEQVKANAFNADLAALEANMRKLGYTAEQTAEAIDRLYAERRGQTPGEAPAPVTITPANDNVPIFGPEGVGPAIKLAATEGDKLQRLLAAIGESGRGSMNDIAGSVLGDLVPAIGQAGDATRSLQDQMSQLGSAIESLFTSIFGRKTGGILGQIANVGLQYYSMSQGSAPIAGARAMGGPVLANSAYLVGERGPEILRMGGRGGSIVPNNQIGGRGVTVSIANDFRGADPEAVVAIKSRIDRLQRELPGMIVQTTADAQSRGIG